MNKKKIKEIETQITSIFSSNSDEKSKKEKLFNLQQKILKLPGDVSYLLQKIYQVLKNINKDLINKTENKENIENIDNINFYKILTGNDYISETSSSDEELMSVDSSSDEELFSDDESSSSSQQLLSDNEKTEDSEDILIDSFDKLSLSTVKDLKKIAKEHKIPKYYKLKKNDLIDELSKLNINI